MPILLEALSISVNTRTRRARCPVHGGDSPYSFSWNQQGWWHCFACGAGGDRLELVRAVRKCKFPEAVQFLADLAGVEYRGRRISAAELAMQQERREAAEAESWHVLRLIIAARGRCDDQLIRCERLQRQIGDLLRDTIDKDHREELLWSILAELAPVSTRLLADKRFLDAADAASLIAFVTGSPVEMAA